MPHSCPFLQSKGWWLENSTLTFPQLLTSTGKEQKWKIPRVRSSSPQLFTLKALGSSKARVAERWSDGLTTSVLGAAVHSNLSDEKRRSEGHTREHMIMIMKKSLCLCVRLVFYVLPQPVGSVLMISSVDKILPFSLLWRVRLGVLSDQNPSNKKEGPARRCLFSYEPYCNNSDNDQSIKDKQAKISVN